MIDSSKMKLWFTTCHKDVPHRREIFYKLINSVKSFNVESLKIIINSDVNFDDNLPIEIFEHEDPWRLVWAHKQYMRKFLESNATHFIHTESNVLLKQSHLDYWLRTRDIFKRAGTNFLPALHRIEYNDKGSAFSLDSGADPGWGRPVIQIEDQLFISCQAPYQGLFIMDRGDVEEHVNSPFVNFMQYVVGIRESANLGCLFINVPYGFQHRMMTPLDPDHFKETWIHHTPNNYAAIAKQANDPIENFLDLYKHLL